jgi:hypothetical protein
MSHLGHPHRSPFTSLGLVAGARPSRWPGGPNRKESETDTAITGVSSHFVAPLRPTVPPHRHHERHR